MKTRKVILILGIIALVVLGINLFLFIKYPMTNELIEIPRTILR